MTQFENIVLVLINMLQDFLQFILQFWYLWALLFALLALIIWFETRTVVGGVIRLGAQELVTLINRENPTVIDVRSADTFKNGHVVGAVNVPEGELVNKQKKLQKFKAKPVVLICGNGQVSGKVAQTLQKEGFEKLYILRGGMPSWKNANLPLEK